MIGSEFSYELLHAVHPIAEEDLQRRSQSGRRGIALRAGHCSGGHLPVQARADPWTPPTRRC